MRKILILLTVFAVNLAGCTPGADATADRDGKAGKLVSDNGFLTVNPAVVDACKHPAGVVATNISWDATRAGTEGVELFLQDHEGQRKLWAAAGAVGGDKTGLWMRHGSEVILVNGQDGRELARIRIRFQDCAH